MLVSIQNLREKEIQNFREVEAKHRKLMSFFDAIAPQTPDSVDKVYPFGYCADFTVEFKPREEEGLVQTLLRLYPPMELVHVSGPSTAQKPVEFLRESEKHGREVVPIYPVIYSDSTAIWWTRLPCGIAKMCVPGVRTYEGVPEDEYERFQANSVTYQGGKVTAFLERKLAPVPVQDSPLTAWENEWRALTDKLRASQVAFANAIKARILQGMPPFRYEELPEPRYDYGGVTTIEARVRRQAARKSHVLDGVGDFWKVFDEASARELVEFSTRMAEALPKARAEEAKAEERVREAIVELCSPYGEYPHYVGSFTARCVEQWLARKTGLNLTLRLDVRHGKGSAWIRFHHRSRGFEFKFDANPVGGDLNAQNLEVLYA